MVECHVTQHTIASNSSLIDNTLTPVHLKIRISFLACVVIARIFFVVVGALASLSPLPTSPSPSASSPPPPLYISPSLSGCFILGGSEIDFWSLTCALIILLASSSVAATAATTTAGR